ncbi:MAG TPA: ice-binding family protein [Anaerolineales bacterium]|nr:ice-binding family protein [Anaerolineales bacterium]
MNRLKALTVSIILALILGVAGPSIYVSAGPLQADSPDLGDATSYSVLAGSIVTNTGLTTVSGDLGISPSIGVAPHYTGFPPGIVGPPGTIHDADAHAAAAQFDATAAFAFLDQPCDTTYAGVQDLTLVSPLVPGTYCADAFLLTGNLTLEGAGVWIFKSAATLTTSAGSSVTGGDPCNVWWRLASSGTLGANTSLIGNILALTDIGLLTGASLNGRALAQTGQVTLDSNNVFGPVCRQGPTNTPVATNTATNTPIPPTATNTNTPAVTPTGTLPTATNTSTATDTPLPETATAIAATGTATTIAATQTAIAATGTATTIAATQTAIALTGTPNPTKTLLPAVTALPGTGAAPIRGDGLDWGWVIVAGSIALAMGLGLREYRSKQRRNQ